MKCMYPLPNKSEWNLLENTATEVVLPPKYKQHPRGQRSKRSHLAISVKGSVLILVVHI